ncbi:MAG: hypothetical protein WD048_02810 [Chitinophagales bacterium]
MKKLILFLSAFVFINLSISAQGSYGHALTISKGYSFINSNGLSNITPIGADPITDHFISSSINLRSHFKGFIIGAEGNMARNSNSYGSIFRKNSDPITIDARLYSGLAQFGYAVLDKSKFKLYPMVGVGANRTKIQIDRQQDIDASQIVDGESMGTTFDLVQRNFLMDFGLGFDYILDCGKKMDKDGADESKMKSKGLLMGVKVGYQLALENDNWRHNGGDVNNGPNYAPSGFYAKLTLGLASFSDQKKFWKGDKK